jgi:hypothetical protein
MELRCAQAAQCERLCNESMRGAPCAVEMEAATRCMLTHPASDWECTPEGLAAIKDGLCTSEQERFASCLEQLLQQR